MKHTPSLMEMKEIIPALPTFHCLMSHLLRAQLVKGNGVHKPDEQTSSSSLSVLEGNWG